MEVRAGRFRKDFIWTIRGGTRRFASEGFVKVSSGRCGVACGGSLWAISQRFVLDGPGWHVEVSSGRFRGGVI